MLAEVACWAEPPCWMSLGFGSYMPGQCLSEPHAGSGSILVQTPWVGQKVHGGSKQHVGLGPMVCRNPVLVRSSKLGEIPCGPKALWWIRSYGGKTTFSLRSDRTVLEPSSHVFKHPSCLDNILIRISWLIMNSCSIPLSRFTLRWRTIFLFSWNLPCWCI